MLHSGHAGFIAQQGWTRPTSRSPSDPGSQTWSIHWCSTFSPHSENSQLLWRSSHHYCGQNDTADIYLHQLFTEKVKIKPNKQKHFKNKSHVSKQLCSLWHLKKIWKVKLVLLYTNIWATENVATVFSNERWDLTIWYLFKICFYLIDRKDTLECRTKKKNFFLWGPVSYCPRPGTYPPGQVLLHSPTMFFCDLPQFGDGLIVWR